jgi:CHAT domain-containing protein
MLNGVEDLSLEELDALFNDNGMQDSPSANNSEHQDSDTKVTDVNDVSKNETKAFAKRLKESTEKAVANEREAIAKSLGYESFADMQQKREKELIENKGLDPEQVTPVIEDIVKQRLNEDPRIKELETLRRKQVEEFGKKELAEITKLTGGEVTSLSQLPKEVIDLWKVNGSLKSAYMQVEGEKLILKMRSEQSKGSTEHLSTPSGNSSSPSNKRLLTEQEKKLWKFFNPSLTDEELNKKTVDK